MKKITIRPILLMTLFCTLMIGCEKEYDKNNCDCSNKQTFGVTNVEGIINFNKDIQKWYIRVHKEDTYDEVQLYLPCNLEEKYKIPDKEVLFSGIASDISLDVTTPAGTHYFCVEISFMSNLN
ncbi:hypothetical protein AGMMS50262_24100 [Bacteroidia bacterium]|nr:hypothetical protein AGMMS50262_24100 [Bacteroidia bacterium]